MGFLKILLGFLSGPLSSISSDIKEAYQSKLNAANDKERVAADERINLLEARKSIILASQSSPTERWVRLGFAIPFVLYNAKLIVWDKMLAWGTTDALGAELSHTGMVILSGFFIDSTVKSVARIIKK
jgi:hypothetical protein